MNDNHHHLELTTMIFLYALAYGKVMKVAALFYLRYVVYDLTICSQLNGIKMSKYQLFLFVEVKWLNSKPTYSMLLFDLSLPMTLHLVLFNLKT